MATEIFKMTRLVDDLDSKTVEGVQTVEFSVEGKRFEIDLGDKNKDRLARVLEPFMNAARPVDKNGKLVSRQVMREAPTKRTGKKAAKKSTGYARPASKSTPSGNITREAQRENMEIREWGRAQGMHVPMRGKIPQAVRTAWEARDNRAPVMSAQATPPNDEPFSMSLIEDQDHDETTMPEAANQ